MKISNDTIENIFKPYLRKLSTLSHMIDRNIMSIILAPADIGKNLVDCFEKISNVEIEALNADEFPHDADKFAEKLREIRFDEEFEGKIFMLYGENQMKDQIIRGFSDYTILIQTADEIESCDEIWKLTSNEDFELIRRNEKSFDEEFEDEIN